jgi:hypothetical protein
MTSISINRSMAAHIIKGYGVLVRNPNVNNADILKVAAMSM